MVVPFGDSLCGLCLPSLTLPSSGGLEDACWWRLLLWACHLWSCARANLVDRDMQARPFSLRSRSSVPGLFLLARPEGMRTVYRHSSSSYSVLTGLVVPKLPCAAMRQPLSLKAHIAVHVHGGRELFRNYSQTLIRWSLIVYALHCLSGEASEWTDDEWTCKSQTYRAATAPHEVVKFPQSYNITHNICPALSALSLLRRHHANTRLTAQSHTCPTTRVAACVTLRHAPCGVNRWLYAAGSRPGWRVCAATTGTVRRHAM